MTDRPKKAESETPEISVVIPMKEEMENVKPLLSEIESALTGECNFEILCIDDGSQDDTLATLVEAKKQHTALRTFCIMQNVAVKAQRP